MLGHPGSRSLEQPTRIRASKRRYDIVLCAAALIQLTSMCDKGTLTREKFAVRDCNRRGHSRVMPSMPGRKPAWFAPLLLVVLLLSIAPAEAANGVEVRAGESSVPAAMNAGATAAVRIRVVNNGTTTWSPGALHRLGAWYDGGFNQVSWNGFGCGGYMNATTDARAFVCNPVPPGATQDIVFNITVPPAASGSVRLAVRMVQDGVEWFGNSYSWSISVVPNSLPDVVVDSVAVSPPNPAPGQPVAFSAVVRAWAPRPRPQACPSG